MEPMRLGELIKQLEDLRNEAGHDDVLIACNRNGISKISLQECSGVTYLNIIAEKLHPLYYSNYVEQPKPQNG